MSTNFLNSEQQPNLPFAYILEQPAKNGARFRYECERRSSVIRGASGPGTFPALAVANYSGPIKVIVSCVTKDPPYRAHPHSVDTNLGYLNSTENSGITVAYFPEPFAIFNNLGILYAKRNTVKEALQKREALGIDPFGAGFSLNRNCCPLDFHKLIDFSCLRLCFQVFIKLVDHQNQNFKEEEFYNWSPLPPIVSETIYDRKRCSELVIVRLSHDSAPTSGGQEVILLCERVVKEDVQVRFFQTLEDAESNGQEVVVWERLALFTSSDVHKNVAIVFTVPPYDLDHQQQNFNSEEESFIPVQIQLRRPSDGCTSVPVTFYYYQNNNIINSTLPSLADNQIFYSSGQQPAWSTLADDEFLLTL